MARYGFYSGTSNKYKNTKVERDGRTFDSVKEYRRYLYLLDMQQAGEISELETQVPYILIPAQYEESNEEYKKGQRAGQKKHGKCIEKEVKYIADFRYRDKDGNLIVEDAKSPVTRTPQYVIKRKLMLKIYGIRIKEI